MQNGAISELYTGDKKHLAALMIFLSQQKTFIKKGQTYKTVIAELFTKTYDKKKSQINNLTIARQTFF